MLTRPIRQRDEIFYKVGSVFSLFDVNVFQAKEVELEVSAIPQL